MAGGLVPNGNGIVYSTGYVLGVATLASPLSWNPETQTLSLGVVPWGNLPIEASKFPMPLSFPGKPGNGTRCLFAIPQGYQIPADFAGTTTIQDIAAAEAAVFTLSIIRAGAAIALGTITLLPAGGVACTLSTQAAFTTQANDALLVVTPSPVDATLSGAGITLLLVKQ